MKKAWVFFLKYFMWSTDTPASCFQARSGFIFFLLIAVYHCLGSRSEKEQTACFGADEESGFQGNTFAYCQRETFAPHTPTRSQGYENKWPAFGPAHGKRSGEGGVAAIVVISHFGAATRTETRHKGDSGTQKLNSPSSQ